MKETFEMEREEAKKKKMQEIIKSIISSFR